MIVKLTTDRKERERISRLGLRINAGRKANIVVEKLNGITREIHRKQFQEGDVL